LKKKSNQNLMNISAFPFTISQQNLLNQKGFRTIDELRRLSVSELSEGKKKKKKKGFDLNGFIIYDL